MFETACLAYSLLPSRRFLASSILHCAGGGAGDAVGAGPPDPRQLQLLQPRLRPQQPRARGPREAAAGHRRGAAAAVLRRGEAGHRGHCGTEHCVAKTHIQSNMTQPNWIFSCSLSLHHITSIVHGPLCFRLKIASSANDMMDFTSQNLKCGKLC